MEQTYEFDGRVYTYEQVVRALRRDHKEQERNRQKAKEQYQRKKAALPVESTNSDALPVESTPAPKDLGNGSQSVGGRITMWNGRPWTPIRIPLPV